MIPLGVVDCSDAHELVPYLTGVGKWQLRLLTNFSILMMTLIERDFTVLPNSRSTFGNANILILLERRDLITEENLGTLLDNLDHLCRKITNFQRILK